MGDIGMMRSSYPMEMGKGGRKKGRKEGERREGGERV